MNVLILNSSPRRNGNISRLLQHAAERVVDAGAPCRVINLYDKDIRNCIGCMECRSRLSCPIPDDMPMIADAIKQADRIIIGAPCYWANMPGILKSMFDRLAYLFISEGKYGIPSPRLKGRRALIISTATTPMPWARLFGQTSATVKSIKRIFNMGGISTIPALQIGGTLNRNIDEKDFRKLNKKISTLLR